MTPISTSTPVRLTKRRWHGGSSISFGNFIPTWSNTRTGITIETHFREILVGASIIFWRQPPWQNAATPQPLTWTHEKLPAPPTAQSFGRSSIEPTGKRGSKQTHLV